MYFRGTGKSSAGQRGASLRVSVSLKGIWPLMSSRTMLPPAALGKNKDTRAAERNNRQGSKTHTVKVAHDIH